MISSKILAQSATAGLMAGAILAVPLFVFGPDETSFNSSCPHATERPDVQPEQRTMRFQPPVLRAAPQREGQQKRPQPRSLEERNRAASQALQHIGEAYEHSTAESQGARIADSVRLQSSAKQTAARVRLSSNVVAKCGAENRGACRQIQNVLPESRPPAPSDQR